MEATFSLAREALASDLDHYITLESFYILSRCDRVWQTCDGVWLHEQLVQFVTSGCDSDHQSVLMALKVITNLAYHLGPKLEQNYMNHCDKIGSFFETQFSRADFFVKYLFLRILYQGGANSGKFRAWLGEQAAQILKISQLVLDEYTHEQEFCFETLRCRWLDVNFLGSFQLMTG